MSGYIIRRVLYTVTVLIAISIFGFVIIELPPGDFVSTKVAQLEATGQRVNQEMVDALRLQYGLDKPVYLRYLTWMRRLVSGNPGMSLDWNRPVMELILERLPLTILLTGATLIFTYLVAIPIGIYSATHQYSLGDYTFTALGFIGLATPNFLLALILMYLLFKLFGISIGGLFSLEYARAEWSLGKLLDMLGHLVAPIVVIGTAGTAWLIRVMRASLLDELRKQYVITARAKGVGERSLLFKYPARIAVNPIVSTVGWLLPVIVSGETITALVLSLPTTGPLLLRALLAQDMYLAATIVIFLTVLTVIGTLLSDLLLAWLDPRIRFDASASA